MKHRHRYAYENWRGFANEFAIYVVPEDWKVENVYSASYAHATRQPITYEKAVRLLRVWRKSHGSRKVYACPVCGYVPEWVAKWEVAEPWWKNDEELREFFQRDR